MASLDLQNRTPKLEVLPDGRYLLTEIWDVLEENAKKKAKFEAKVKLAIATEHPEYTGCRLIKQGFLEPSLKPSQDRAQYFRIYETLSATAETQVGEATKVRLDDGRDAWEYTYRQFTAGALTPGTIGTSTAPDNASLFLMKVEAPDDGSVRTITRTYVEAGLLSQSDEEKNNAALHIRTLVYAKTVPSTPSGYTLIGTQVKSPSGYPVYTCTYARGNGQISQEDSEKNNGGLLLRSIRYLTVPGATNPISTPGGYAATGPGSYTEADGYRIWTREFAKGDGEISRKTSYRNSADGGENGVTIVAITHLTGPAVSSNPTDAPSGTSLIDLEINDQDGYRLWQVVYAKGIGRTAASRRSREDGSVVYTVTELAVSEDTPDYPGAGTGHLVEDGHDQGEGYFLNRAVYIKLPVTRTIKVPYNWHKPGLASFDGTDLILSGNVSLKLLADAEISYSNSPEETPPFTVEAWASFKESYTMSSNGNVVTRTDALVGYLSGATSVSGSNDVYRGVDCDEFAAVLISSIPSSRPTGTTVLDVQNDEYLYDLNTEEIIYRRTIVRYDF